jgi:hypothetical protein
VPAGVVVALVSIRLFRWAARKPPPHATKKAPPGPDTEEPSDPRS